MSKLVKCQKCFCGICSISDDEIVIYAKAKVTGDKSGKLTASCSTCNVEVVIIHPDNLKTEIKTETKTAKPENCTCDVCSILNDEQKTPEQKLFLIYLKIPYKNNHVTH